MGEMVNGNFEANSMFFGRGPIQLSWNYNYHAAGQALGVDLCTMPELVATYPEVAWCTAIWFWMSSGGSTGRTSHMAVVDGSFGGTVNTINGGLECPGDGTHRASIISRINKYCRAAEQLGAELLTFDSCSGLEDLYSTCTSSGSNDSSCPSCISLVDHELSLGSKDICSLNYV